MPIKAGFAERDITPSIGMEMPGRYHKAFNTSVHDPLKVRAAVFDDGARKVALVSVDTCMIQARTVALARESIRRRFGLRPKCVMIAATHTHSGGPLCGIGYLAEEVRAAPPHIRKLALRESIIEDRRYHARVVRQIVSAVGRAYAKRKPSVLRIGTGREADAAFNRRFRMRNGRTFTHPGKGNPNIVAPAGPIDPDVGVVAAFDMRGRLQGCVVNYACHATTLGGSAVSADWICYLEETLRAGTQPNAVVVFLNGASGDVTQVDNRSLREPEFGEKWARHVGVRVGAEALKVMASAEPVSDARVAGCSEVLKISRRRPGAKSLVQASELIRNATEHERSSTAWVFAKERLILGYLLQKNPAAKVEIQAVQIGPTVVLANPTEFFCELGLEVKRRSRFPVTFVAELANGSVGYVPTREAFSRSGGGYETVLTSYSNLIPAAGVLLVEASVKLSHRLKPPKPIKRKRPHGSSLGVGPWTYGVLRPEID